MVYFAGVIADSVTPLAAKESAFGEGRLESTSCWFEAGVGWPKHECYYFSVPENHADQDARAVVFPVLIFRSPAPIEGLAPLLHLGGGGPGAPLYLDSASGVHSLWVNHDEMSLNQGRDLYVMDPRGTGLAKPLLTCLNYVEQVIEQWQKNLTLEQEWRAADKNYLACFHEQREHVDFAAYNSLTIARDVELLRSTLGIKRWVLIGVPYGSIYAQTIVREFPGTVEALILDSAAFPNLHADHNYVAQTMAPYEALFGYCDADPSCDVPIERVPQRLWDLVDVLDKNPLATEITHPTKGGQIEILLNGHRMVESLIDGTYGEAIFRQLPAIITELERGRTSSITPFIESYLGFLLDTTYGDVSAISHYCYETKPFTNFDKIRTAAKELPAGFISDYARLSIEWPDLCDPLGVGPGNASIGAALETDIPTLFLHGELDPVTRLEDVRSQQQRFSNSVVVTFPLSHDVLSSDQCAEVIAAKFVQNSGLSGADLTCR